MPQEIVDAAQVLLYAAVDELVNLVDQTVQEITVVRDHDNRPVVGLERLFQHILRTDVHVVRRLVKRQQIVCPEHQLGHRQARPLPAAQHRHLLVDVLPLEEEGCQDIAQLRTDVPHCDPVQRVVHGGLFVKDIFLILGIVADIHVVAHLRLAGERRQLAHQHPHHRRLALAVAAHEGHLLPALHNQVRAF